MKKDSLFPLEKWVVFLTTLGIFIIPYLIVNHTYVHRIQLPFILGEEHIPFLPWTFIIYLSLFIQAFVVVMSRFMTITILKEVLLLSILIVLFHLFSFAQLMPTEYPRIRSCEGIPFVHLFNNIDLPRNCFPSLHVSMTIFLSGCYAYVQPRTIYKIAMWVWTTLIILSVLTTKQHYIIDIAGSLWLMGGIRLLLKLKKPRTHS